MDFSNEFSKNNVSMYNLSGSENGLDVVNNDLKQDISQTQIIVNSVKNEEVLTIRFNKKSKKLIVTTTQAIPNIASKEDYFTLILKDRDGNDLIKATLKSNENGNSFRAAVNGKSFEFSNNVLVLIYKYKSKIQIINHPNIGRRYTPTFNADAFKILESRLEPFFFQSRIKIVNDKNEEVTTLFFIKSLNSKNIFIISTHTDAIATNALENNEKYIELLKYNINNLEIYGEILSKETGERFSNLLNNTKVQISEPFDILRISNKISNRVIINDYKGQTEYLLGQEPEFLKLEANRIVPYELKYNKIRFRNLDNSNILFMYFNKIESIVANIIYIQLYSTGVKNIDSNYFYFKIFDETETNIKLEGRINKGESGNVINIDPPYNASRNFDIGDILEIGFSRGNLVEIFDYPLEGDKYNPSGNVEKFRITTTGLSEIKYLSNEFIINTFNTNKEIGRILFNRSDFKLVVKSTGLNYGRVNNDVAFKVELLSADGLVVKKAAYIMGNENADNFRNNLNGKNFRFNDLLLITFLDIDKIFLNNYPKKNALYTMKISDKQSFRITKKGIVPNILPNEIILNNENKNPILNIQFDMLINKVIVYNTGNTTSTSGSENYFTMTLYEADGETLIKTFKISGNDNGNDFVKAFNNFNFKYGGIITIECEEMKNVVITSYPDIYNSFYTPSESIQSFKITENGFIATLINSQEINLSNVAVVRFNGDMKKLISTGTLNKPAPNLKNIVYYLFKLRTPEGAIKKYEYIRSDEDGIFFKNGLNNFSFEFGDIIEIASYKPNKIEVKNFPEMGSRRFVNERPFNGETYERFFKITKQGLKTYTPSTKPPTTAIESFIKINKVDGSKLTEIVFNAVDKMIETFLFDTLADQYNKYDYVNFKLYNEDKVVIFESTLLSNDLPRPVTTHLNQVRFDYGYILDLTYDYKAKTNVVINYIQDKNHIPQNTRERYFISSNGLSLINVFLENIITIYDVEDKLIAFIEFDALENKFKALSFGYMADPSYEYDYVTFKIYNLTDITLSAPVVIISLPSNELSLTFMESLNDTYFIYGYILEIICSKKALNRVSISNFPSTKQNYVQSSESKYYEITNKGLVSFYPKSILKENQLIVRSYEFMYNYSMIISFDNDTKQIKAFAREDRVGASNLGNYAFSYKLKSSDGTLKKEDYVRAYDPVFYPNSGSGVDLAKALDGTAFEYGDIFEVYAPVRDYTSIDKVAYYLSNVPLKDNMYYPFNDTESFTITDLGLLLNSDSPLGSAPILRNIIFLNNYDNHQMLQIYFHITMKKLLVSNTNIKTQDRSTDKDYFIITIKDEAGNQKDVARIKGNIHAENFAYALNNYEFEFGDRITLHCKLSGKIGILNYPNFNNTYGLRNDEDNTFIITINGLVPLN